MKFRGFITWKSPRKHRFTPSCDVVRDLLRPTFALSKMPIRYTGISVVKHKTGAKEWDIDRIIELKTKTIFEIMKTKTARVIENPIIKDRVTFLETAAETAGKLTLVQVELAPDGGNELHYHKTFDETFTVLEGVLGIQLGTQIIYLNKGESATASTGSLHRFFNPSSSEKVVFNVLLQPGSTGFETTLQVAYGLAGDGRTNRKGVPKNLYHMALIIQWSDTNLPGLFSWLEPVMRWLARRAEKKGIHKALVAEYCNF